MRAVNNSVRVAERERYRDPDRERGQGEWIRRDHGEREDLRQVLVDKRNRSESLATDQNSVKPLDDLFRKTNSHPHIYWLPLTPEQVKNQCTH